MGITQVLRAALVAAPLALAACGGVQPAGTGDAPASMDHGSMPAATSMAGMDHGAMGMEANDAPYDAQFIDSMIVHHQGAIDMANGALEQTQREELRALAQNIIAAQTAEIEQLQQWRAAWYPNLPATQGMGMDMGDMAVSEDAATPYEQRFIAAMVAHHEGAIAMARDARQKAEHAEIKTLADNIIAAQESEITQMRQWQQEWTK